VLEISVIGQFLFLLYNNDIKIITTTDNNNKSKSELFADETRLFISSPNTLDFIENIKGAMTGIKIFFSPYPANVGKMVAPASANK
jgi:hypothetical protein